MSSIWKDLEDAKKVWEKERCVTDEREILRHQRLFFVDRLKENARLITHRIDMISGKKTKNQALLPRFGVCLDEGLLWLDRKCGKSRRRGRLNSKPISEYVLFPEFNPRRGLDEDITVFHTHGFLHLPKRTNDDLIEGLIDRITSRAVKEGLVKENKSKNFVQISKIKDQSELFARIAYQSKDQKRLTVNGLPFLDSGSLLMKQSFDG